MILKRNSTIGIFGGGQLGKMIAMAAANFGYKTIIFTNEKDSSASFVTNKTIVAEYDDKEKIIEFAKLVDVATLEFENIPVQTIEIFNKYKKIYPGANVLKITQDRVFEKNFLRSIKVPTVEYCEVSTKDDIANFIQKHGKSILKTAKFGYDGKGQYKISINQDIENIDANLFKQKLIIEKECNFKNEFSIIIARNSKGEIAMYEPISNKHINGILDTSTYPSSLSPNQIESAFSVAKVVAREIDLQGILAIEMFIDEDNIILVNEMAPRPHNSGHITLDACHTSQFQQLIRVITGMDFGSTYFHSTGYMKNLIGEDIEEIEEYAKNPYAIIYSYCKDLAKNGRKMGHINNIKPNIRSISDDNF